MNVLSIDLNHFKLEDIRFLDPKLNLVMTGLFIKIMYTTSFYTLNSIYFTFQGGNRENLLLLKKIELSILEKYLEQSKKMKTIHLSVVSYSFQRFSNIKDCSLKISGIWESEREIGLIYKLLEISTIS